MFCVTGNVALFLFFGSVLKLIAFMDVTEAYNLLCIHYLVEHKHVKQNLYRMSGDTHKQIELLTHLIHSKISEGFAYVSFFWTVLMNESSGFSHSRCVIKCMLILFIILHRSFVYQ